MWSTIILTIILISAIHWFYNEFFGYWKKRGVPHPRTLPLIGNLTWSLTLIALSNRLNQAYNNFKDCLYVGFYEFQQPIIIVRDIELIRTIATKKFSHFQNNQFFVTEDNDPVFAKNLFVLKGQLWRDVRPQIVSAISIEKIKNDMFHLTWNVSKNMVQVLNEKIKNSKPIDSKELSACYTTDVTASCVFGFEGNALNDPNSEFRKITRKMFETSMLTKIKLFFLITNPYLGNILKASFIQKNATKLLINFFQNVVKYREMNSIVQNDFLDQLISHKSKCSENDESFLSHIISVIVGSIEASSVSLNLVLYELGYNDKVQTKLQEEIDNIIKEYNGEITYEIVQSMNYLDMVVAESLRKYPPTMFLNRVCTKQFTLPPAKCEGKGSNVTLEIGTPIIIPIYAVQNDPIYYPEPEKFIPERFSEEARKSRPKSCYFPFGEGPRMCLGYPLGLAQIKLALISILANFNIKLNPKTTPTFEVDIETTLIGKKGGIWLNFDKRIH